MRTTFILVAIVPILALTHGCVVTDESETSVDDAVPTEDDGTAVEEFSTTPTHCEMACLMCDAYGVQNIRDQCDDQTPDQGFPEVAVCGGLSLPCDAARLGAMDAQAMCLRACDDR